MDPSVQPELATAPTRIPAASKMARRKVVAADVPLEPTTPITSRRSDGFPARAWQSRA